MKNKPEEGDKVYIQGFEFIATNVRVIEEEINRIGHAPVIGKFLRFKGVCSPDKRNDSIRGTSYDGAEYGWKVE